MLEILNSINKFYLLLIKRKDVLRQNPGVTSCIRINKRDTKKELTDFINNDVTELAFKLFTGL